MMKWEKNSSGILISESGRTLNIISYVMAFFGVIAFLISLIFLFSFLSPFSYEIGYAISALFFSFVLITLPFGYKNSNLKFKLKIKSIEKELEISFSDPTSKIQFPFFDFKKYYIDLVYTSGGNNRRTPSYILYLVKKDGSFFWLDTFRSVESLKEKLDIIREVFLLPVEDTSGNGLSDSNNAEYPQNQFQTNDFEKTPFVKIVPKSNFQEIEILQPSSFFQKLVKFSIFSIFILVPITALLTNFTEGDYLFLIFFIPFMGIFLSIVFIIFLSISRRCKVLVNSFTIKVKLDFPFPLNFLLKTEIEIPTSKIQYVRSNRLMDGNIWLSLHLSESFNMDELGFKKYLFNLSGMNIPRNDFAGFKHIIGLWNIFFLNKEGKSATYKDALYVENFIQDIIRLEEREVE